MPSCCPSQPPLGLQSSRLASFTQPVGQAINTAGPRYAFFEASRIYRSDVGKTTSKSKAESTASRQSTRPQTREHDGRTVPSPSSTMSSDRLFLDRVGRHQSPSPLHRHAQINTQSPKAPAKGDISTLLGIRHFYFALTRTILCLDRPCFGVYAIGD